MLDRGDQAGHDPEAAAGSQEARPPPWTALSARLSDLSESIARSTGWRRRGIAVAAGMASVLAMAPFFFWPVLLATLPLAVWLIDGAGRRAGSGSRDLAASARTPWLRAAGPILVAAHDGWWFGFGYFLAGLFWIGEAFLVEAEIFGWLMPFAVLLMPGGLALFTALTFALASGLWQPGRHARVLVLALAFGLLEWTRGHIFTGFPWNVLGYALTAPLELMQAAGLFGIYGLTILTVIVCATPLVVLADAKADTAPWPRAALAMIAAWSLAPIVGLFAYGSAVLPAGPAPVVTDVKIRLVQPSVPQRDKWSREKQREIFEDHLTLSRTAPSGERDDLAGITHVVWPEAAMPFLPLATPEALQAIGELLPPRTYLLSGALRLEQSMPGDTVEPSVTPRRRVYNSLIAFGVGGGAVAIYDKIHLVPFGEYLPFQETLEAIGLESLTRLRGGFSVGEMPRPLMHVPGLPPLGPLICYEAIFPAAVVQGAERPGLLVNVTNDGWFGNTTGPHQHLHQARVRAIEEGLPLLRVANNGISAVIDPYGRELGRIGLNERGTLDTELPQPASPTYYAAYGNNTFFIFAALLALAAYVRLYRI